jgi:prepilin-type N-terminal cleavage/methylation domain-containing protein
MARKLYKNNKGFTLVELAIVLVIIGLLVGGVLTGQELVKQAEISNVIKQINEYDTGVSTFRAKYESYLPGDYPNAYKMRIVLDPATGTQDVAGTADSQQDGDGDGLLDNHTDSSFNAFSGEMINFWIHLYNTGLIREPLKQDNSACTVACDRTVDVAFPSTSFGTGLVALTGSTASLQYVLGTGNPLDNLNRAEGAGTDGAVGDTLTPEQAYAIDTKLDDGIPDTGGVVVITRFNGGVFTTDSADAADCFNTTYNLALTDLLCSIRIRSSG